MPETCCQSLMLRCWEEFGSLQLLSHNFGQIMVFMMSLRPFACTLHFTSIPPRNTSREVPLRSPMLAPPRFHILRYTHCWLTNAVCCRVVNLLYTLPKFLSLNFESMVACGISPFWVKFGILFLKIWNQCSAKLSMPTNVSCCQLGLLYLRISTHEQSNPWVAATEIRQFDISCPRLTFIDEVDTLLCTDCFHDGRFVIGHSSIDFIRVDLTRDYGELDGDSWTDQETLLLLEAMEIYHENWNEIAEHVGTKSKAQCILHFLRLPMEDGKLENINVPSMSLSSNVMNRDDSGRQHCYSNGDTAGPVHQIRDSDSRLPFANSGNPVMALVAFLASAVGPRVAASCAHAALAVLSEDNSGSTSQMEAPGHDNRTNPESTHSRDGGPHGETAISNNHNDDKAKGLGSWGLNEGRTTPLSAEKVKDAAKAGLSAAAMKAKLFADHEEREIQRLCANIVNHQLKRLELKLKQFAEIETLLMKECEQLERTKQRYAAERTRIISARLGTAGASPTMNASGVGPSMASNGNNRQQMICASPSQPSISGYGNNQPVHPHMSFAPRPSMFGLGQRLPLSMIQQSQSTSSTAMFNAPSNVQPTTNHPLLRPVSGTNSGLG